MKQEDKELLLKDICARLPYGVKGRVSRSDHNNRKCEFVATIDGKLYDRFAVFQESWYDNVTIKPYLFPLSSMTEEQLYNNPIGFTQMLIIKADRDWENITINRRAYYKLEDWFNKNHFDRGLIKKDLAIDATGLNIY